LNIAWLRSLSLCLTLSSKFCKETPPPYSGLNFTCLSLGSCPKALLINSWTFFCFWSFYLTKSRSPSKRRCCTFTFMYFFPELLSSAPSGNLSISRYSVLLSGPSYALDREDSVISLQLSNCFFFSGSLSPLSFCLSKDPGKYPFLL